MGANWMLQQRLLPQQGRSENFGHTGQWQKAADMLGKELCTACEAIHAAAQCQQYGNLLSQSRCSVGVQDCQ
jgi:hypothetical protein